MKIIDEEEVNRTPDSKVLCQMYHRFCIAEVYVFGFSSLQLKSISQKVLVNVYDFVFVCDLSAMEYVFTACEPCKLHGWTQCAFVCVCVRSSPCVVLNSN